MARKAAKKANRNAVRQGQKPSYGKPPKEHQFQPGHSGNPKGPPVRRTNLWVWFCKYMEMTDQQIAKLDKKKLTQAQQAALRLVERAKSGERCGSERMARYVVDREEGRAVEHIVIGGENVDSVLADTQAEVESILERAQADLE